jgi:hypothetical protein
MIRKNTITENGSMMKKTGLVFTRLKEEYTTEHGSKIDVRERAA